MIHHLLSHSDTADWLKVNQFFVEQVAYVAGKLDAIQEGERTALDNSMLMYCSSMLTGGHDATKLPLVILGAPAVDWNRAASSITSTSRIARCAAFISP